MTVENPSTDERYSDNSESNEERQSMVQQLNEMYMERRHKLEGFLAAARAISDSLEGLRRFDSHADSVAYPEYREPMVQDIKEMKDLLAEFGNAYETLGYDIEEIHAELAVR